MWQNDNAIIIGNHQCALAEINEPFVKDKKIKVARRVTGGVAVYHDFGNLNGTIIEALAMLGIKAEILGRNDSVINGLKVSGQAQRLYKNKSKGIQSVRSRVTNIKEHLSDPSQDIHFFRKKLQYFLPVKVVIKKLNSLQNN